MYDGFWKAGKKHGLGVFRPAPEETGSRRHSNHMGWQQQQQQQPRVSGTGADFPPPDPAAESAFAGQEQLAAISTSSDSHGVLQAGTAAGPAQGVHLQEQRESKHSLAGTSGSILGGQSRQQPQPQQLSLPPEQPSVAKQLLVGRQHLVSPFLAAAAALNSETSIVGEPPKLPNGSWQQQHGPDLAAEAAAAAAGTSRGASPAAAAGGDIPSSSSPTEATTAAAEGAVAPAAMALSSAAPRKLFVREYVMGQLVREYPLTAEEIKMIFGFLWPKQNKVGCRLWAKRSKGGGEGSRVGWSGGGSWG